MIVGITLSTFDLLHTGHILMLKECKENCDHLIVGMQTDPTIDRPDTKNKPVQSVYERYVQLMGCSFVDLIIPYSTERDALNILKTNPINIRFLGEEYEDKDFTGKQYCVDNLIKLYYNKRQHDYSTTELRKRMSIK